MAVANLEDVITIIREIREDLADDTITAESRPVEDLGLDSLDLIQLARRLRKGHQTELFFEDWAWRTSPLGTITDHLHTI